MVQKGLKPRGRPRSFDADAVLDKARAVFWNLGYAATSLDKVAEAAGFSKGAVYSNFSGKEELCMEVIDAIHADTVRIER